MLHRVSFLLHRAKKILYKKEGEIVRVRNTVPVLVNNSCKIINKYPFARDVVKTSDLNLNAKVF